MRPIEHEVVREFIDQQMYLFYQNKTASLADLKLKTLLKRKNPYLFRAKNLLTPEDLVNEWVNASLSSSEEKKFGDILEALAIFICEMTCNGRKSSARGIDLEFDDSSIRYIVAIKSGPNWGNSSQYQSLEANFRTALVVQRQSKTHPSLQAVLGICYGILNADRGLYSVRAGKHFWQLISGDPTLYHMILNLIGESADRRARSFDEELNMLRERLVLELQTSFLTVDGKIDWRAILDLNSGGKNAP